MESIIKNRGFAKTFNDYVKNKVENNFEDRLNLLMISLKNICEPAVHSDSTSENIKWTRNEAHLVLVQVASVLNSLNT